MQLQTFQRWKRRLAEDPYNAIFGASEDLLKGKGLKNWDWVHKSFPKWMLDEMGVEERLKRGDGEGGKGGKKVRIEDGDGG